MVNKKLHQPYRLNNGNILFGSVFTVLAGLSWAGMSSQPAYTHAATTTNVGTISASSESPDTSNLRVNPNGTFAGNATTKVLNSNNYEAAIVTNVRTVNNQVVYTDKSQYFNLYNTNEDLSTSTFTVADAGDPTHSYYSGHFQRVTVGGKEYYGIFLPANVLQTAFQHESTANVAAAINITGGSQISSRPSLLKVTKMAASVSATLPSVQQTADNSLASTKIAGQQLTLQDTNGRQVATVDLTAADITVTNDNSDAGNYSYQLSTQGRTRVNQKIADLNTTNAATPGPYYELATSNTTGQITLNAPQPATANFDFAYTDVDTNQVVQTDSVSGTVGTNGQYQVKAPSNYQLVSGSPTTINYTIANSNQPQVIRIQRQPTTTPVPATGTVDFVYTDVNTHQVVKRDQRTGDVSSSGQYQAQVPANYQLVDPGQATVAYNVTDDNQAIVIGVRQAAAIQGTPVVQPSVTPSDEIKPPPIVTTPHPAAVTIQYVDADTNQVLRYELLTGTIGQPVHFDTYQFIPDLQQSGYYIVSNGTARLQTVYFGNHSQTFTVVMRRHRPAVIGTSKPTSGRHRQSSLPAATQPVPSSPAVNAETSGRATTLPATSARNAEDSAAHVTQSPRVTRPLLKRARTAIGHALQIKKQTDPITIDDTDRLLGMADPNGGKGGNPGDELAAYFISLSGRVNFGE